MYEHLGRFRGVANGAQLPPTPTPLFSGTFFRNNDVLNGIKYNHGHECSQNARNSISGNLVDVACPCTPRLSCLCHKVAISP